MNAEFLEKYIVISSETTGEGVAAVTTYSAPKVRKGLDAIAFMGAYVVTADKTKAAPVMAAQSNGTTITFTVSFLDEGMTFKYTIATGEITVVSN